MTQEFELADHTRRGGDKLTILRQMRSVEKYLVEYRSKILMIGEMYEGEKMDRFVEGIKCNVKIEVMKSGCDRFGDCARMALNVDIAIWGAKRTLAPFTLTRHSGESTSNSMEIENFNGSKFSKSNREQRREDLNLEACFKGHKAGCRPWKSGFSRVNNILNETSDPVSEGSTIVLFNSEIE